MTNFFVHLSLGQKINFLPFSRKMGADMRRENNFPPGRRAVFTLGHNFSPKALIYMISACWEITMTYSHIIITL